MNKNVARTLRMGEAVEYAVRPGERVNVCLLGEDIRKGQRVEEFMVEGLVDGSCRYWVKARLLGISVYCVSQLVNLKKSV